MSTSSLADVTEGAANADDPEVQGPEVQDAEVAERVAASPGIPRHPIVLPPLVGLPLLAFAAFGFGTQALVTALAAAVLVALAAIDIEHRVLPNRILLPATVILLAAQLAFFPDRALEWLLAGVAAAAFLALPLIIRRDAMGIGDIKLAVLLGVVTGWGVFGAIVIGCLAMVPAALWLLRRDGSIRGATLPFGPFLALGTLVVLFTA